jgi:hypothetical protein
MDMLPYYRNKFMLVDYYRKKGKLIHLDLPQEEIDRKMLRCGHETICEECGKAYIDHPYIDNVMDETGDRIQPFLHYICDGTIAKL